MKKTVKQLFFLSIVAALFTSCKKDENRIYYKGAADSLVLSASVTSPDLPLSFSNKDNEAIKLSWTNPNYQFTTGISSQDVNYQIEIDTAGSDFTSPKKQTVSVSKELSKSFLVSEFNGFLLNQLVLDTSVPHHIEIRLKSFLTNQSAVLYSNVLKYTVVPYAIPPVVAPPASGTLFIVGSATPGGSNHGWDNPISQSAAAQQFTTVSKTLFTIKIPLIGGGEYKFIAVNGSWTDQWSIKVNDDPAEIYGGDFIFNGQNILAPPASATYKIDVDFQRGKFTVVKQ